MQVGGFSESEIVVNLLRSLRRAHPVLQPQGNRCSDLNTTELSVFTALLRCNLHTVKHLLVTWTVWWLWTTVYPSCILHQNQDIEHAHHPDVPSGPSGVSSLSCHPPHHSSFFSHYRFAFSRCSVNGIIWKRLFCVCLASALRNAFEIHLCYRIYG